MLRYVDQNGGPGNHANPEPVFGPTHPFFDIVSYYLRPRGKKFPRNSFGRGVELPLGFGHETVRFLDARVSDLEKVGHISAEEWSFMVIQWEFMAADRWGID